MPAKTPPKKAPKKTRKKSTAKRRSRGGGEQTRAHILETALSLFRKRGFDKTTMRQVAEAADMSLGAAYYYFSSKEAIVLAYYERVSAERAKRVRAALENTPELRERLRCIYHLHFDVVRRDRKLLGALVRSVADPDSEASVFSKATASVRNQGIALFEQALDVEAVGEDLRDLGSLALWTLDLALMLYFVWDTSPKQARTRQLVDDTIDALLPVIPLLSLPMAEPMRTHLAQLLVHADLVPEDPASC